MLKALAVSALLGCADAKKRSDKEQEGLAVAKGFFIGSATVDMPPEHNKQLEDCMDYLEHVVTYADNIYDSFKAYKRKAGLSEGFYDVMTGLKFVSTMVHMITTSESNCQTVAAEWGRIKEIANTWNHPSDFSFDNDKEILFNGENLYPYISKSLQYYEEKDFENFGQ